EGRGGGSGDLGSAVPDTPTPTPDPSPAEPRYSEGSATLQSDRSRQQPTSVGGGEKAIPAWLTTPVPTESRHSVIVSPSSAYEEAVAPRVSPRQRDAAHEQVQAQALARGTLIHRLLQSLPDIEPARREAAALSFLARANAAFSMDERNLFVGQTLAIFA